MEELKSIDQLKEGTVFVELYSENCSNCKKQAKITEALIKDYPTIRFFQSDSENTIGCGLCEEHELMQAPSMLIYEDGKLIKKFGGLTVPNKLKEILNEVDQCK